MSIGTRHLRALPLLPAALGFVVLALLAHTGRAEYFSSDSRLPSPSYHSTDEVVYSTPAGDYRIDSFFDIFPEWVRIAPPPPGGSIDSFFDVFTELSLQEPGGSPSLRESPTRHTIRFTDNSLGLPPGEVVIETEMLQMDLMGGTLPAGLMIRESPTLPSLGRTTITDVGGGLYRIDSFFDVFTELSIDGGQTWTPGSGPMRLTGTPEPSTLVLGGFGLVACVAVVFRRVRKGR